MRCSVHMFFFSSGMRYLFRHGGTKGFDNLSPFEMDQPFLFHWPSSLVRRISLSRPDFDLCTKGVSPRPKISSLGRFQVGQGDA